MLVTDKIRILGSGATSAIALPLSNSTYSQNSQDMTQSDRTSSSKNP
ncbi:hypothetical protein [Nostoc sphaeroides]|nr:hypothetical protein [Nostoc sphaeroides]